MKGEKSNSPLYSIAFEDILISPSLPQCNMSNLLIYLVFAAKQGGILCKDLRTSTQQHFCSHFLSLLSDNLTLFQIKNVKISATTNTEEVKSK